MTKQEILNAFIQAENDWSEPIERASENETDVGLCWYFYYTTNLDDAEIDEFLRPYWVKYRTKTSAYHFNGHGDEPQGRAERLEAIRKVINDLKNELNENN